MAPAFIGDGEIDPSAVDPSFPARDAAPSAKLPGLPLTAP